MTNPHGPGQSGLEQNGPVTTIVTRHRTDR